MTINNDSILPCITLEPSHTATKSVIWLHGLGADGNDFAPIVPELKLPNDANVRFIFPHAPIIPVTINNGYEMRAWYDIYGLSIEGKVDAHGISLSLGHVNKLIQHEISRGIDTENIFLAGFSQGAAIALIAGLCYAKPLAGVIALSGYLPMTQDILQKAHQANKQTPFFIAHGTSDSVVPHALGLSVKNALEQAGYDIEWHDYAMAHSVCPQEIRDISNWLQERL